MFISGVTFAEGGGSSKPTGWSCGGWEQAGYGQQVTPAIRSSGGGQNSPRRSTLFSPREFAFLFLIHRLGAMMLVDGLLRGSAGISIFGKSFVKQIA